MENEIPPREQTPTPEERAEAAAPEVGAQPASFPSPAEAAAAEARAPEQPAAPSYGPPRPPSAPPYPPYPYAGAPQPRPPIAPDRRTVPWWGWLVGGVLVLLALTLIGCCALSGLFVGVFSHTFGSGPEATESLTRTFTVNGAPTLVVRDPAGNITVKPGSDGQVIVQATKRARDVSTDAARRHLQDIQVDVSQNGNIITVEARLSRDEGFNGGHERAVDVDLTVPVASQFTADVAAGNVTIRQIVGQMNVTAAAGNVETQDTTFAGASHIAVTAGNITLDGAMNSGSLLDVRVESGNITLRLPANIPAHLDAQADVGNVSVIGWPLTAARQGATGAKALGDLAPGPTDTITLRVKAGNITVQAR